MRRVSIILLIAVAGCTSSQELASTVPSTSAPVVTTATVGPTSTTAGPTSTTEPTTTATLPELRSLAYDEVQVIDFPIQMVALDGTTSLLATKDGQVWLFEPSGLTATKLLDIADQVRNQGEQGLLSVAVDPADTSRVFVHYSANDGDTVVSGFTRDGNSLTDEQVLLRLDQPAGNHNGGMVQFGPDGALYLGLGDGGGANDRFGNGQNTNTLLGGIVRIDVNDPDSEPELFQYGLRNPWRFWFDDDLIYIADVGQNQYEEVSVAPIVADINYGWPRTEGLHCFRPSSGCDTGGLTLPVIEVSHGDAGTCSITGGMVYRGAAIPEIDGHYFYSDYCGGYLRSFRFEDGTAVDITDWTDQVGNAERVASFGTDSDGEMYVLTTDRILKVVAVR